MSDDAKIEELEWRIQILRERLESLQRENRELRKRRDAKRVVFDVIRRMKDGNGVKEMVVGTFQTDEGVRVEIQ